MDTTTTDEAEALATVLAASVRQVITSEYPKLVDTWTELWDQEERVKRKEILVAHLTDTFSNLVDEIVSKETQTKEEYIARVEGLLDEIGKFEEALQVKISYNDVEALPLHLMAKRLNQKAERYREIVNERVAKLHQLQASEAALVESLGALPIDLSLSEVPTESQLENLEQHIQALEREKMNRMGRFMEKRQRIIEFYQALGIGPCLEFEKNVVDEARSTPFKLTNENMDQLNDVLERLERKLREAQENRDQIVDSLRTMWGYLEDPPEYQEKILDEFFGYTATHLESLKKELERCKKEKSANIGKFVERIRTEISNQWDKCLVSDDVRNECRVFRLTYYNEDIYDLHQLELDRWKKFYSDNQRIFELYNQHAGWFEKLLELNGRGRNANRYQNRGGQLLQEERQRKLVAKELPRVEEELRALAAEYNNKHGEPFTVLGQDLTAAMNDKWEAHFDQKTIKKFRNPAISQLRTPLAAKRPAVPSSSTGAKQSRLAPPSVKKTPQCARKLMPQDEMQLPDSTMNLEPSYDEFQRTFKSKLGNKLASRSTEVLTPNKLRREKTTIVTAARSHPALHTPKTVPRRAKPEPLQTRTPARNRLPVIL